MDETTDQFNYPKNATRGRETMFRVVFRTQLNLIRIADNKANMIMGINAMIITILIGILSSRMIFTAESFSADPGMMFPVVLILMTALLTAIFAIKAARPKIIMPKEDGMSGDAKGSYTFFENIWDMDSNEYMSKMKMLINSPNDIYENMITDIHNQAKVLHSKYRSLRVAYMIFLVGYSLSIVSFLFLWLSAQVL
jgi:hypothetical protein